MPTAEVAIADARLTGVTDGAIRVFRGIRYAVARRFRVPTPVEVTGSVDAGSFGPACPQPRGGPVLVPGLEPTGDLSEDCLTLNVWSPEGAAELPVVVWIHGGSFLIGAASSPTYDATRLAGLGAVVVTLQYRLGPFGFIDLSALGTGDRVANAGLHDIACGVEWVRRNIAAFGGDADRVTVMGESAGGGCILHLLGAPRRSQWFDRAIIQSGSTGRTFTPEVAARLGERLVALSGCTSVDELDEVAADRLVAASLALQSDPDAWAVAGLMPFHPCVDGSLVTAAPDAALTAGASGGCDVVLGATRDEMQLFVNDVDLAAARLERRVARYLDIDDSVARAVIDDYVEAQRREGRSAGLVDVWGAIYSDREMVLPARGALDACAKAHGATYGYRFDWTAPPRPDGRLLGAAHGVDIPFSFGNFADGWDEFVGGSTATRETLSAAMRASWVAFAATGDPSTPDLVWPRWESDRCGVVFDVETRVEEDPLGTRGRSLP